MKTNRERNFVSNRCLHFIQSRVY